MLLFIYSILKIASKTKRDQIMFPPHIPRRSLTFIGGSVLTLGILLFAIFFILSRKDQAVNGGHHIPQASSNAIRANQNPSSGTMGRSLPVSPSAAETHRKSNSNQWNRAQDRAISGHAENYEGRSRIEFQGNQSISTERLNVVISSLVADKCLFYGYKAQKRLKSLTQTLFF
jgi:hypothetical protein